MNSLNLFQWIALSCLLIALVAELYIVIHRRIHRGFWALRVLVWISAAIAIYSPGQLTQIARMLGIERGADFLSYMTAIVFFMTSLFLYARCKQLQHQITSIVRHIAIGEAELSGRLADGTNTDRDM